MKKVVSGITHYSGIQQDGAALTDSSQEKASHQSACNPLGKRSENSGLEWLRDRVSPYRPFSGEEEKGLEILGDAAIRRRSSLAFSHSHQ